MKKLLLIIAFLWGLPLLAQQQIPIVSGVVTADMSSGITSFKVNLNQNVTSVVLTGQRPGSGGNTVVCTLFFVQDAIGGWTVTFGGNINGAFAVTATPGATTVEQFAFDFTSNQWYVVNAGAAGSSGISGSGTANFFTQFTGTTSIGNAPMNIASGVTLSQNPFSITGPLLFPCTNSASGTSQNLLATFDSNGNCITLPNGNTARIVGVCYSGCGTSGTAQIAVLGTTPVILDNQSTINDYLVAGANGQGHDAGATFPTGVQVIGLAESVNTGTGTLANGNISILNILNPSGSTGQTFQVNGATIAGSLANLNNTTPAAGANFLNCFFQTDNVTPVSDVSLECPLATTSQVGFVQLAQDLGGTSTLPVVQGIQTIPVTFSNIAVSDVICFPTTSTLVNCPLGVPVRTVTGNSDAILATDRVTDVRYTASSGATAVTLAQAGTTGFASNFTTLLTNAQGSGTVTVTATTSTFNGSGSTLAIAAGSYCFIYSDNSNYYANCGTITGTSGSVTSVGLSVPATSIFGVTGSPVTGSGTLGLTTTGTSGGIPYFSSTSQVASSGILNTNVLVKGAGAGAAPTNSTVIDTGTSPTQTPQGLTTVNQGNYDTWTVDTGGVTANKLACRSGTNKAVICPTSTTQGVLGVALGTVTVGNPATICWAAHCSVIPTNNTTAGHWLIPSTTVAGDVDDTGSTSQPTGKQSFLAESTVTAPAVVATTILSPDSIGANAGGSVTAVTASGFLASSGGATPNITVAHSQGTDTNLLTAGTVSGTGASLCTDANGGATTSGCSGGGGAGTTFPLENCTPDTSGLVFWTVNALSNWRDGHWEYSDTIASATHLYCKVKIPHTLPSGTADIILFNLNANDGTASHTMTFKTCDIVPTTTINVGALSCASTQNFTTTSTAYAPSTLVFAVQSTLAIDNQLIVDVQATTESSLTANVQLEGAYLEFR